MLCFPCGSDGKESACNAGDLGSIPGLGRSPGEGKGYPLQYPGLENSVDCIVSCKELDTTEQLSLSCHIIHFFLCGGKTYLKLDAYNTVLVSIITILCATSPGPIY